VPSVEPQEAGTHNESGWFAELRHRAEELGYKVLEADDPHAMIKFITGGEVDAIIGVASAKVLEHAVAMIPLAGIPCSLIPTSAIDSCEPEVDLEWVRQLLRIPYQPAERQARTFVHLLRAASHMFESDEFDHLCPVTRPSEVTHDDFERLIQTDPIAATERLAFDFIRRGGKQSRPFILLAVYDALTGALSTLTDGDQAARAIPDSVKRTAMSIETFHKASLVHDDIQDDDEFRYGLETLHRRYGIPSAINIGDFLIGLGYRLVSRDRRMLGAEKAADILDFLADSHQRLCEGQGAELFWRDRLDKRITPDEALKIYALKTSPAFEAAMFCGARLADLADSYEAPFRAFARNLGVAFQILNDLKDWEADDHNKKRAGDDLLKGRPTVLWALALEGLKPERQAELITLVERSNLSENARILKARELFVEADVFNLAYRLVDKHQRRAKAIADEVEPVELRRLLHYIIESVLDRSQDAKPDLEMNPMQYSASLPIASK
jgi:geranylgeranyl pyrophosphate synthase